MVGNLPVRDFYSAFDEDRRNPTVPAELRQIDGDVVVILSNDKFRSITGFWRRPKKKMAVLVEESDPSWAPSAVPNILAHEFGHVLGMFHSMTPDTLMCGEPTRCYFRPPQEGIRPLTKAEETVLSQLYPPDWTERRPVLRQEADPPSQPGAG